MLNDLKVVSYMQMEDNNKFLDALSLEPEKIDFNLLQACLNVYKPPERHSQSSQEAIQSIFLTAFKSNVPKAVDYLDIDRSGAVNKAEFVEGIKKIVREYDPIEFQTLYSIISRQSNAREIPNSQMKEHFEKFLEKQLEMKRNQLSNGRSTSENFEIVREKIRRFFNMDTTVFYQDLLTFDTEGKGRVTFSQLTYYLSYTTISLSDEDRKTLGLMFHAVASTPLMIDYVTSMIFFGKANSHTLGEVDRTLIQKMFFSQIREEMNLYKLSSFDIFQDFLSLVSQGGDGKQTLSKVDLQAIINKKQLGLSSDEISELYSLIAHDAKDGFDYRLFRAELYGRELGDVTWLIFKLDERLRSQQLQLQQHFFKPGQQEISSKECCDMLLALDPLLKYDEMDLLFCKMDKNANNRIDYKELELIFTEHSVLCDFKQYLVKYAEKNGKDLADILSLTDNYDSLLKEEFRKLVKEITESNFTEDQIGRMFRLLDKDNDSAVSKIELKEILDLAQKQLYNSREFLTFKNGVIDYCESKNMTLRQLFQRYADRASGSISKVEIKRMAEDTIKYSGIKVGVIQKALDANMNDTIDYSEFKEAILNSNIDVDNLIVNIKRILANRNEDFHAIFKTFDTDNNDMIDAYEFKNFIKKLGIRLNFIEGEKLFDILAISNKDQINKKDFFGTLVADTKDQVSSRNIATVIQQYKAKVDLLNSSIIQILEQIKN
jgi:Ca2+-binding EF-hand superfamily protein